MARRWRRGRTTNAEALFFIIFFPVIILGGIIALIVKLFSRKSKHKTHRNVPKKRTTNNKKIKPYVAKPTKYKKRYYIKNTLKKADAKYETKVSLMTECEQEYYQAIKEILSGNYEIQPQINLASVVSKLNHEQYRTELFRNIDFGIFDGSYKIKVLIEINDKTHEQEDRKKRDKEVKRICSAAGIPLITFWVKFGVDKVYIKKRLSEYIDV